MNEIKIFFEAHKVDLFRSNKLILKNLNLKINDNESIAILGPNGSGKTTLIKTINREIYPAIKKSSYLKIYGKKTWNCLLYTSPSPRDMRRSRMPSSA